MNTTLRACVATGLALLISGCVIDPNAFPSYPPSNGGTDNGGTGGGGAPQPGAREFVKPITYANGQVSYFRTLNSSEVKPNHFRICLENNTGQPKAMVWSKVQSGVSNLNAPKNGSRSCASFNLNQRLEWVFYDRLMPKKADAMNVGGIGGTLIEFIWVRDY